VRKQTLQSCLAVALSLQLSIATAGSPAIGTIITKGAFRVDHATVHGNATLLEGSLLETATASSSIQLNSGTRLSLAADSRGRLFGDRLVLEKGTTNLEDAAGFRLVALGLTIQPGRGASTARVSYDGSNRVRVAAGSASLRVLNSNGQLVANVAAGAAMAFEPQPGSASATRVTGVLENRSGRYMLTDEVTNVTVEVTGNGLAGEVGNRVEITGSADPAAAPGKGATQLVRAREVRRIAKGAAVAGGVAVPAATGTAAAGAAGGTILGIGTTTVAVVGGVAAAAVVGGLAAADQLPGQDAAPQSR
jgi:hypothetical protein